MEDNMKDIEKDIINDVSNELSNDVNKDISSDISSDVDSEVSNDNKDITNKKKKNKSNFFYDWIVPIVIAILLAVGINKYVIFKVKIPSESMVPTLNIGDRLYVSRVYNLEKLERGDVVVFESKEFNEKMIKRLIGLPGDKVEINNGIVTVNGKTLVENYLGTVDNISGSYTVPEGKYFFLGDNRYWSRDSRYWQNPYIDADDILGKAQVKVYPLKDFGWIK